MTSKEQEVLEGYITQNNLKITSQRRAVLDAFIKSENHVSAEDLYKMVQEAAFEGNKTNSVEVFFSTLKKSLEEKDQKLDLPNPSFDEIKNIYLGQVDKVFARSLEVYSPSNL